MSKHFRFCLFVKTNPFPSLFNFPTKFVFYMSSAFRRLLFYRWQLVVLYLLRCLNDNIDEVKESNVK